MQGLKNMKSNKRTTTLDVIKGMHSFNHTFKSKKTYTRKLKHKNKEE